MRSALFTILAFFLISNAVADTEPNNTQQTALTLPQDRTVAGTQSDEDWYVINVVTGKRILIDLTFSDADGNIDMDLLKDILRARSDSSSDHESIDNDISLSGAGAYYIRVYGADQGSSYTLTWTELTGADDNFEENDFGGEAKPIIKDAIAFGSQSDEDWYSINVNSGSTRVLASLRFTKLGKLDIELLDTDGNSQASSTNSAAGVNEVIDVDVPMAGTYHLLITGDNSSDGYALNWAAVSSTSIATFPTPAVNEAPQAIANSVSTTENIPYSFMASDFTFSDNEDDSLVSATLSSLSLGGGSLTHSGSTAVNNADTLSATQLATLVYTPPVDSAGSPLATFDFTVNDFDAGMVAAQMSINVTEVTPTTDTTTTPVSTGSSSGALSPAWILALMLAGLLRRKLR